MMLKMLVFFATHHFIDLCTSKVRYYREGWGVGGGLRVLTSNRKTAKHFLPCE